MKTKAQKVKAVEGGIEEVNASTTLVFADFSGVTVEEFKKLRAALRVSGAKFKVIKKRLLSVVFKKLGLDFDPKQFEGQVGTVFAVNPISDIAGPVYKFSRETLGADKRERFKILGGYDLPGKRFLEAQEVKMIGQLPSREVLLGQLMGAISGPLRAFLYILSEKAKKS